MMDIYTELENKVSQISEEDIAGIAKSIVSSYNPKTTRYLTAQAYSINSADDGFKLALKSFHKEMEITVCEALSTYIHKEHWNKDIPIKSYIDKAIRRMSNSLYWKYSDKKKQKALICPLCKEKNFKIILKEENNKLHCYFCHNKMKFLLEEISSCKGDITDLQSEYMSHSFFAIHSKKGYRCPDCFRFIPQSVRQGDNVHCPYGDCPFFGDILQVSPMLHPAKNSGKRIADTSIDDGYDKEVVEYLSKYDANAEEVMLFREDFDNKLELLEEVISMQMAEVERNSFETTKEQKLMMYQAYKKMTEKHPSDMIHYLFHRKQVSEPLQSKIFQTYANIVESVLPITIKKNGDDIDIMSLTDPNLSLFRGVSEFESYVRDDHTIPNETTERYIGGHAYKDYGPCFIGRLIDIIDVESGQSLMDKVESYSFSRIILNDDVAPCTKVMVKHFRILSHYEMDSLVFLQKIRKRIVDSLYFRTHKKKRVAGE